MTKIKIKKATYKNLLDKVSNLIEEARRKTVRHINTVITQTYWEIGRLIVEEEQRGEKRAEYGEYLIRRLAKDLTKQFGKGFTERNLWWMKQFYITYPKLYAMRTEFEKDEKLYALRTQLSWTHFRILMNVNFLIRRISFVTPENERKRLLKKFKKMYYDFLKEGN